ncbi:hypothetical protein FOA43_004220 [Brettanomyces nanus]|uniref:Uncharacterized protein n=1 Tax=Eeniella nana TaxID=13502 RepID=A0A875S667_EENNA|nr:uncharacterized protein FOA43_004220 [Brettanomyces nanus]QPG76826.1 hypothetical protein FOA43_004220 [Brettanomyces nanus]
MTLESFVTQLHSPSQISGLLKPIKSVIESLLDQVDVDDFLLQINGLRSFVEKHIVNNNFNHLQLSVVWLCFFECYLRRFGPGSEELANARSVTEYIFSLGVSYFNKVDLGVIYSDHLLTKMFNHFVTQFVLLNNPLGISYLFDSVCHYISMDPSTLNYLQIFTVRQLFIQNRIHQIVQLYSGSGICDFTRIDSASLSKDHILLFYFDVARSLFIDAKYTESYKTFVVIFHLPVNLVDRLLIDELLSVYVVNLLLLEKDYRSLNDILIRFSSLIPSNILNIFHCYQAAQFNQFVRLVYLEYVQRLEAHGQKEYIFTKPVITLLITHLAKIKFGSSCGKLVNVPMLDLNHIDPTARTLDILDSLDIRIDRADVRQRLQSSGDYEVSSKHLLTTVVELAQCNSSLGRSLQDEKGLRNLQKQTNTYSQ